MQTQPTAMQAMAHEENCDDMKWRKLVVAIALFVALGLSFFAGSQIELDKEEMFNYIVHGHIIALNKDSFVLERDPKEAPGQYEEWQDYYVFQVNEDTNVYAWQGMTNVPLDELEVGHYVEVRFSKVRDESTEIDCSSVKLQLEDFPRW